MAKNPFETFEIPNEMRSFAEQSVTQARQAVDGFMAAATKAVDQLHGQTAAAQTSARDVTQKAMGFAEQNVAASFEFAERLVKAANTEEVLKLQREFIERQMKSLSDQARDIGENATRMARDATGQAS